jgi:membrane protease YdiL (CAAX protease family)
VAVVAVSCFIAYGVFTGSLIMHWHIPLIFPLYFLWGLVQQFLIVALLAGNLRKHSRVPRRWIVLLTALVFALAHAASLPLTLAAFFLAAVTTTVYFRTRNLWALGLFHGLFATGLYFFALGQDLWAEVVSARLWP